MTLDRRLDSMIGGPPSDEPAPAPDPVDALTAPEAPAVEPVQVAGLGKVKKLLEPLLKPGARMADRDAVKLAPPTSEATPAVAPAPVVAPAPAKPPPIKAAPLDQALKLEKEREALIAAGDTGGKPPAQAFNTNVFDDEGMAATIKAVADASGVDYSKMTVRSIYQAALAQGISEDMVRKMLAGEKMSTKVGDSELAQHAARMLTVFDASGKQLDGLFSKMSTGELDDLGKLELRKQLAIHNLLGPSMKGFQVDVTRTMNVFKRVRGPGINASQVQAVLKEIGDDSTLLQLANDYLDSPTRAGKNLLVETGFGAKMREAWFYIFQSNLLNDVNTHFVNLSGNAVFGVLQPIERLLATGVGRLRTLTPGSNPDRYTMEDNYATASGFMNMIGDGWQLAAASIRKDTSTGLKADQVARQNPLTSDALSDVPVTAFGKEVWRTPDLKGTPAGMVIDGLATLQSLPFRALNTVDEGFGGMAARWKLHSEAWTHANKEYDRLMATREAVPITANLDQLEKVKTIGVASLQREMERLATSKQVLEKSGGTAEDVETATKWQKRAEETIADAKNIRSDKDINQWWLNQEQLLSDRHSGANVDRAVRRIPPPAGMSEDEATREVQRQVAQLMTERPADMQASIESFRKMVTFQNDLSDFREVPTGEFYWRAAQVFQNPMLKVIQPFIRTLSNIWIEGTARTPGLNFISPRFYADWNAGGPQRDLAVARLAMGGSAVASFASAGLDNRVTGYGPPQNEDRAALERTGWLPYSVVFETGELSSRNLERLSKITKVSAGDNKVYVSFARFEPLSMLLAMGADTADAVKFHRGGEWDEDIESMVKTGGFVASNYITQLPLAQGIGEIIKTFRSRSEDGGEKFMQVMDGLAKQYGNFALTGAPVVGLANSSLMAHAERLYNPTRSNTMPDKADVPYGVRAFYEASQRVRSRIPGLSDGVPPALDSLGRELESTTGRNEHWLNWVPAMTARSGKRSEVDELLVSLDFGVNEPPKKLDGVQMSATQYNRYKKLYGQEIKLDGMNLERFIPQMISKAEEDAMTAGEVLTVGDKQKLIMQFVGKYRTLAKMRLIGDPEGLPLPGDDLGLAGDKIEFPDLKVLIDRQKRLGDIYGR